MLRFLAIAFFVYVVYKLVKLLFFGLFVGKAPRKESTNTSYESPEKKKKIVSEEEGEYVDFEEIKDE